MKTLIVMRHGKALPPTQGQRDEDRSLSEAGVLALRARLPHMLGLLEPIEGTSRIWTSPALRACQTSGLLEEALHDLPVSLAKTVEPHDSLWRQDVDAFVGELRDGDAEAVFAVGHAPFVEDVVERLAGSTPPFSTGALCCLEVRDADDGAEGAGLTGRVLWFAQGPRSKDWGTLVSLQEAITATAADVEHYFGAFLAEPDDIENIHRFRTRTRSLRSLIAFIKPWQNRQQNAETQAILKEIVGHTSLLRELDVFEKQARSNPDSSPKLIKFCKRAAATERTEVLRYFSSKQVARAFGHAMGLAKHVAWKRRCLRGGLPAKDVRRRFDDLVASVSADLESLRLSDEERTHDVRKRAKRARYVSERFQAVVGADAAEIAKGMMAHQDDLGDVCDARANVRLIQEFLQRDLPDVVIWELNLLRARNEEYLYAVLRADESRH